MAKPVFNEQRCKSCELCTVACPKKIIGIAGYLNTNGFHPAICKDESACIGCALCARICPDMAIEVYK